MKRGSTGYKLYGKPCKGVKEPTSFQTHSMTEMFWQKVSAGV